jgi:hypothetical protein
MSLSERANSMSLLRLIIIGVIGFAWLIVVMLILVGSIGAFRMGKWVPGTVDKVMDKVGEAMERAQSGGNEEAVEETEFEVTNADDTPESEQTEQV